MNSPAATYPTLPMIAAQDRGDASLRSTPPAGRLPAGRISPRALDDGDFATQALKSMVRDSLTLAKEFLRTGQTEHVELHITQAEQALAQLDQLTSTPETILEA